MKDHPYKTKVVSEQKIKEQTRAKLQIFPPASYEACIEYQTFALMKSRDTQREKHHSVINEKRH